ncbi:LysR family transcriptional regulator [Arvimicrobium flavum]|uniref:LysR family transcriptional regulator n=1 Tax=Arvimicrobium flavum TaxID=3393320 RepID=UPI00237A3222|nr:LysR substrate-binding domain-containing protein [Mesorhizobium shangrilense]
MKQHHVPEIALRHFKAFMAVLEAGGLAPAGKQLRRSPSSISRSVGILEKAFGCPLVFRSFAGMTATPEGRMVEGRCQIIKAELDACGGLLARLQRATLRPNAAILEMQPDVSHLRALIAVHDFKSVQRAANLLSVSQPAISYSIRLLEADLGVELFSRMSTGMIATPEGVTVTFAARRILSEISKIVDDIRSSDGFSSGLVCVGGLAYSRTAILPDAIKQVLSQNPNIVVRTVEGPIDSLLTALHGDEIDVIICAHPDRALLEGISVEPIAKDPMGLFVSVDHPLAARPQLTLKEILAHPFILPPAGSITRQMLEDFFRNAGCERPRGRAETSSYSVVRNLLIESDYIAFRSLREFQIQNPDDRIVALDVSVSLPERIICLLQRRDGRPTAAISEFIKVVRDVSGTGTGPTATLGPR